MIADVEHHCEDTDVNYSSMLNPDMLQQAYAMAEEWIEGNELIEDNEISDESDNELCPNVEDVNILKVGHVLPSKRAVQNAIYHYALKTKFNFQIKKSCKRRFYLSCIDKNCRWVFKASKTGSTGAFKIRTFFSADIHTCPNEERFKETNNTNSRFVADAVKKQYQTSPTYYGPLSIKAEIMNKYGVDIDYSKAWRAREIVTTEVMGNPKLAFQDVPSYLYLLEKSNPGSLTRLKTLDNGAFMYAFIALSASIKGYKYCRPQVVVDGAFLMTAYGGTLLTACTYNAAGGILPLAFAIVDSENNEAYHWFFDCFRDAYGYSEGMCFISDRAECIAYGVKQVYPEAGHYCCIYHLENNLKSKCRKNHKDLHDWFFEAAKAYTKDQFDNAVAKLRKLSPAVVQFLQRDAPYEKWAALYSKHYRRQAMTSNIAESLNSRNKKNRDLPITALLEQLRCVVQLWGIKFRKQASYTMTKLTEKYNKIIRRRMLKSSELKHEESSDCIHKVTEDNTAYVVNLEERTCTCNKFQVDELPCRHALHVIVKKGLDMYEFCSSLYFNETLRKCYKPIVHPICTADEKSIPEEVKSIVVMPPPRKVRVGRLQKKRGRAWHEKIRDNKCGTCRKGNHNRRTCPNLPIG